MVNIRLLILVSEVQVHNVLSKSRGLDFPSNFTSVFSMEKASPKQNYRVFPNATPSLDLRAGRGSSISKDSRDLIN